MIQLIWFLLKIGILVAGAVWLAARPGSVDIQWMEYEITIHFGFFLLLFFALLLLTIALTRFSLFFTGLPGRRKFKKTIKNNDKGLEALTLSLSSAAAGDYGYAQSHAERALKLLPGNQPLPLLLKAGAQRKQGNYDAAETSLKSMLSHPEGAVLAARALIGNAVEQNNIAGALSYARTADKDYKGKDKAWLLATLYELEAKAQNWEAADANLYKATKKNAIPKVKSNNDYVAIGTSRAREYQIIGDDYNAVKTLKAVLKKNASFAPAVEDLYHLYIKQSKKRAAASLLKKAWSKQPHPDFVELWIQLGPDFGKSVNDVNWLRKLTNQKSNHVESYLALAESNMAARNYDYAKQDLEHANGLSDRRRIFKLWAKLTEKTGGSEASIRHRLEQIADAKADPTWVCSQTGHTYPNWSAIALPHGSFNTIIWASPDDVSRTSPANQNSEFFEMLTAS